MPRRANPLTLTAAERHELERRVRARTSRQQEAQRARIVLGAAAGATNVDIGVAVGVARHTVQCWRERFATARLAGLADRPHQPPPRRYGPDRQAQVVVLACQQPGELGWPGQTHWTIADLAQSIRDHPALGLGAPREHRPSHPPGARCPPGSALTPGWPSATPLSCPRRSRSSGCNSTRRPTGRPAARSLRPAGEHARRRGGRILRGCRRSPPLWQSRGCREDRRAHSPRCRTTMSW